MTELPTPQTDRPTCYIRTNVGVKAEAMGYSRVIMIDFVYGREIRTS